MHRIRQHYIKPAWKKLKHFSRVPNNVWSFCFAANNRCGFPLERWRNQAFNQLIFYRKGSHVIFGCVLWQTTFTSNRHAQLLLHKCRYAARLVLRSFFKFVLHLSKLPLTKFKCGRDLLCCIHISILNTLIYWMQCLIYTPYIS